MQIETMQAIQQALNTSVRPTLRQHGGDVEVLSFEDGVLKLRMLGPCANCPSAALENEQIFEEEIKQAVPQVARVVLVTGVSDDLLDMARDLLQNR